VSRERAAASEAASIAIDRAAAWRSCNPHPPLHNQKSNSTCPLKNFRKIHSTNTKTKSIFICHSVFIETHIDGKLAAENASSGWGGRAIVGMPGDSAFALFEQERNEKMAKENKEFLDKLRVHY